MGVAPGSPQNRLHQQHSGVGWVLRTAVWGDRPMRQCASMSVRLCDYASASASASASVSVLETPTLTSRGTVGVR
eukprot:14461809-Alexandrium_andersonii.AAC.2